MSVSIPVYVLTSLGVGLLASWLLFVPFLLIAGFFSSLKKRDEYKDKKYIVYIENFYARFKYSRVVIICILLSFAYHYLVAIQ